jgi:ribosome maturation factor RimP
MRKEIAELWNFIEPVARGAGFDLVELQWGREGGGWALRVFIDRPYSPDDGPRLPGATGPDELFEQPGVGFAECERVSHDLSAALDVADLIPHGYALEVSSPGLERPLRREQDFRRFAGEQVKVRTTSPVEGRRNFVGKLAGAEAGVIEVESDGHRYRVPIDLVAKANVVPDWAAEFRRSTGGGNARDGRVGDDPDPRRRRGSNKPSSRSAS